MGKLCAHNFAAVKNVKIWIVSIIIGVSFLGLLGLQMRYIEQMVNIRKEQFDASVFRSLNLAARNLEQNETFRYLESFVQDNIAQDTTSLQDFLKIDVSELDRTDKNRPLLTPNVPRADSHFQVHTIIKHPAAMPKVLRVDHTGSIDDAAKSFQEYVKNAYVYHKGLLDDVIYTILYKASEKPLEERINFKLLDQDIRNALEANNVDIPYHFIVSTADGREVYRCPDYDDKGKDYSYSQVLFRNDPTGRIGVMKVHFPEMDKYLLQTAHLMIPAIAFTIILFVTFVYTICVIFRQKKITEMKNDFINNMTHEFKTPISSISLAAQMLNDPAVKKSETTYSSLSRVINDETKRLRFQVEKVLQMSLFDSGNIAFNKKDTDAHVLLQNIIKTFTLKVTQCNGTLTSDFKAERTQIHVDEMHFTNVIFNLMDNAVKYRRDDTPLHLVIHTHNASDKLFITVEDNGIGIRKEDLKRVFERFFRVHTGNKHDVKGFGLGLAYVKKIITLHHGSIFAESEYGKGTKFIIILPLINKEQTHGRKS